MLTKRLVNRFAGPEDPVKNPEFRTRVGILEGWVGVIVNIILFLIKGAMGVMSGSIALIADAIHTLADMATSIVVIVGFRIARKPFDEEHPFGHGRAETIATLVVAVLLIVAGVEFLRSSIERLIHPRILNISWFMLGILFVTLVIKEWLARFSRKLGRQIGSDALEADFWHHRTDSIATGLVIVSFILARFGVLWVDGVAGIGVSIIIVWTGFTIGRRSVSHLLGEAPTDEEVEDIRRTALAVDGVEGVHDIIVHRYGESEVISLHIEVDSNEDPMDLHTISEIVENRISQGKPRLVVAHIDPVNRDHPHYEAIRRLLDTAVAEDSRCESFHDLRIIGSAEHFNVLFDIAVPSHLGKKEEHSLKAKITSLLEKRFPGIGVIIEIEPMFVQRH
ncbi:MAG: cation diffusion facilitator family transporter [Candidatus Eisenbacteria bacterium]|uniref:Cation diffusion facilitator family transporter n=1 Tax=Eiseniibacteriota bacterium TaxID=2212470 RepID=A0A948RVD2_UNCEI|nr:cation diffusion facilitator family transporter [Candidatus Eisenbacteria bacterium]MBU1948911.1 cation diffusion facilitator family transporter [Candidatus Eisenbacteria bacterium]MBU2691715.1 cation diffusion facilitator family transporter [Candidatus Eisenbacteria bacterium]